MANTLLILIYLAFISLGLPDSLLGSAWPVMHKQIQVPISYSGIIFMIISVGTVISSLNSDKLISRFGTAKVTAVSTLTTALALFCFSLSGSFLPLCLFAVPYGLGAGAIDAALNNYVAVHYASRHMSWLHCMWGLGALTGPFIMAAALNQNNNWHAGYRHVGLLQLGLALVLFAALSLWKSTQGSSEEKKERSLTLKEVFAIPGVREMMITFFCYCAMEQTSGLWASSWLVNVKGIDAPTAARFASLFYIGITAGRALSGFITLKLNDTQMVRLGLMIITLGCILLLQNYSDTLCLIGLIVVGLGCAPVYPSLIHSTPSRFAGNPSQSIIGVQMASAYVGNTLMPPFFGILVRLFDVSLFPVYLIVILLIMILGHERLIQKTH
ncbi:MAG: MFS transporter [Erysipelotrichaceae bacterium]|nr:MFS transporter [Erysipelotrichaceae bacterium]